MKDELERFASLDFNDASIVVTVDAETKVFQVDFEGAADALSRAYVDGRFRVRQWEHLTVRTVEQEGNVIVDPSVVPIPDFVFEHETVGDVLILDGLTAEPKATKWMFEGYRDFQLAITRGSVWLDDDAGAREVEVPLKNGLPSTEFAECCVMIETPDIENNRLEQEYARLCFHDANERGEFAYMPYVLEVASIRANEGGGELEWVERSRAAWACVADATVVYTDFGETQRMRDLMIQASRETRPLRFRRLFAPKEAKQFMAAYTS